MVGEWVAVVVVSHTQAPLSLSLRFLLRYALFEEEMRAEGVHSPNDINDRFFSKQFSGSDMHNKEAHEWWPEMYRDSEDWQKLVELLNEGAIDFAVRLVNARGGPRITREDMYASTYHVIWAAVYPEVSKNKSVSVIVKSE